MTTRPPAFVLALIRQYSRTPRITHTRDLGSVLKMVRRAAVDRGMGIRA